MLLSETLARRRLVVVTGKGGVGKTAVAASLSDLLARAGRRVLVLELDPRESAHQMLDVSPTGGELVRVRDGLFLQNLRPRKVLDKVVGEQVRLELIAKRVLDSPVYHHFAEGAPGLKELAVVGYVIRLLRGLEAGAPVLDQVVLDAPATGHGASLLQAPGLVAEVIQQGPFGRMTAEAARFVADPGECGVVVVTQGEEMPVTEALELRERLSRDLRRQPDALIVNGLYPRVPGGWSPPPDWRPLAGLWRSRRRLNEKELTRLDEAWPEPRWELPLLPLKAGPELVAHLAEALAGPPAARGGGRCSA